MSEELVFFSDGPVTVTNARFIVGSQTYAVRNISSVAAVRIVPNRHAESLLVGFGIAAVALGSVMQDGSRRSGVIGVGILMFLVGVLLWVFRKSTYSVSIMSNSGQIQALRHRDYAYVAQIVQALNQAMIA